MVIASLKRKPFKLPLPGYTNGAMERCYNRLHIKWHPITAFISGEQELSSNDRLPLVSHACFRWVVMHVKIKEIEWTYYRDIFNITQFTEPFIFVWHWKLWDQYHRAQDGIALSVLYVMSFPWIASTDKMEHNPAPPGPHHRRTPKGPRVLPPFQMWECT